MADLQSIIKIIFSGDDQVSQTAKNISKQLSGIGDIATGIATPFADLANKILILDAAVSAVALVIGVKAVQAANEFGAGLADLNRFLSEGEGNAQQYKQQFDDLSVKYGTNVNEIVKSTSDWRAANFDIKTSLDLTKIALDYSIAGQITAGESTETLKKIVSGMAIENDKVVESSKRMGDVLNFVADNSKTNFKEIAAGVALIAPSISTSGASFEQMTAIVSVLTESLQSGARAGEAIAVITGQLKSPSKLAAEALKELGLEVDKNNITQQSFYQILSKIGEKWPTLTGAEKENYAQRLVSAEQVTRFQVIMENWGTVGVRATKAVSDATLSMSKEVERALNTSSAAFKSFEKSLDLLFITLGTQISPGIVEVVKSLTEFDVALKKVAEGKDSPFKPLSDSLSGALGEFSKVIDAVTKNLPAALQNVDFSGLIRSFDGLFGELDNLFRAFFGDIDVTTVEGLSDALQKIVDVGSTLVTTTQGIVAAFKPFAEAAGRAVDEFVKLDKGSQLDFGKFIGSAKLLIDAGLGVGSALIAIGQAGADMASAIDIAFRAAKVTINTIQIAAGGIALLVTELAYKIAEVTKFAYSVVGDEAKVNEINIALAGLQKTANELTADIERNKQEWRDGFVPAVSDAGQKAKDANNSLLGMSLGLNDVKDSANRATGEVQDTAAELGKLADIKLDKIEVQFSSKGEAAEAAGQIKKVGEEAQQLVPKLVTVRDENGKVVRSYTEMTNVIPGVTGGLSILGSSMDKTKDKAKDAAKESDNFRIKMEEIASNERIKNIEAYVSLNVAELEAQTKQVEAAFDSINTTINSTGDLIGSLFGSYDKADTFTKLQIIEQIEAENKRRDAALQLQKELTQAEIENIRAKTRALDRGDSILKIDGTGLAPQLEAFMWEILKAIRVRANADFADYLLGIATT
ncbi:MAG: phage tail tape measure protein [Candidatus Obscuribacter sp.]|nr:phage tail tape measure protein [Candidatus Obscuribacter sp.]